MASTAPPSSATDPLQDPVWDAGYSVPAVSQFFAAPNFAGAGNPSATGNAWIQCMKGQGLDMTDIGTVWNKGYDASAANRGIYNKLTSTDADSQMPPGNPWPPEIIEQFRIWYNQGGRRKPTDPYPGSFGAPATPIPAPAATRVVVIPQNPVWNAGNPNVDDVRMCFTSPCWIQNGAGIAAGWRQRMLQFQYTPPNTMFDLQSYDHVSGKADEIYYHLVSQSMPPYEPFFSAEACEMVRLWYNTGCPQLPSDVKGVKPPNKLIPAPQTDNPGSPLPPKPFQTRQDINTLTAQQLNAYREALLNAGALSLNSTWQTGGFLHANWCLHYKQASFPWHRAHLLWLEQQLGVPIPYWNFYSSKATDPTNEDSGIPKAFLDETFIDSNNKTQPNPLLWALARNGLSRDGTHTQVQRDPAFGSSAADRATYISKWTQMYLDQIWTASQNKTIVGAGTNTWVLDTEPLNDFTQSNAGTDKHGQQIYALGMNDFDGLLELAHDNLHGWVGVDMANNSYAAFDPLFWSYHANFDRLFETWIRKYSQPNWGATPLRPFFLSTTGNITVDEDEKSGFITTIDMIQESKALGYAYAPPGNPDYVNSTSSTSLARAPIVLFQNTKCTTKTYYIHVGVDNGDGKKLTVDDPGYIGSITRLGMGPNDGNNRCIKDGILRKLDASKAVAAVGGIKEGSEVKLKTLVSEDVPVQPNKEVAESEYESMPGFTPVVVWVPTAGGAPTQ